MRYALFLGCNVQARLKEYADSAKTALKGLGVEAVDLKDFGCCGYPLEGVDPRTALVLSARNLALAQGFGLDLLVLCQCCYGTLKRAKVNCEANQGVRDEVNRILEREGLKYEGGVKVLHLLHLLYKEVGPEGIKTRVKRPLTGLKVAPHYGCHALRPSVLMELDDPIDPKAMEEILSALGAEPLPWSKRLDCCGAPLLGVDDDLSLKFMKSKVEGCLEIGADLLCVCCPYCHLQFDKGQLRTFGRTLVKPILLTQLIGLSLGYIPEGLGIPSGQVDALGHRVFNI